MKKYFNFFILNLKNFNKFNLTLISFLRSAHIVSSFENSGEVWWVLLSFSKIPNNMAGNVLYDNLKMYFTSSTQILTLPCVI